jgi:glucokinase
MTATADLVLGVDLGGTNTAFGLVDLSGQCLARGTMATDSRFPVAQFFQRLHENSQALLAGLKGGQALAGIGIGAPNANPFTGTIEHPPNLQWDFVDVRAELARYGPFPVAVTNDANAVALGEMLFGAAKGMRDFIAITLGTGLGSGIVVNGELVYGSDGLAGEMGHLTVTPRSDRECGCGRVGCLETYASATGIVRTALELMSIRRAPSVLGRIPSAELTSRLIFEAAQSQDALAREAFEVTGRVLGAKLADMVLLNRPQAIILFGGLAEAGNLIFDPTRRAMDASLPADCRGKVPLLPSALDGSEAAILGAAATIWTELRGKVPPAGG